MRSTKYLFITLFLLCVFNIAWAAGGNASELITEGKGLLAKGEYDAAEAKFKEAIKKKEDPEAWLLLGTALNRKGAYNKALEALNRAKELKTESKAISFEMGCAYMGLGKYKEAYKSFSEDISHNLPWRDTSYLFCGICLHGLGEYRKAITHLSSPMLKGTKHSPNAHYYTGLCQLKLKEHKEAARSFRRAKVQAAKGTKIANDAKKMLGLVEEVIKAKKKRRPWYASLTMGASKDTNVISAGDDMTLPSDISSRRDIMGSLFLSAGYRLYQASKSELWIDYRGSATFQHDLDNYNTLMQGNALRGRRLLTPKLKAGMKVSYDYTWVDERSYSGIFGLSPSLTYRQREWTASTFTYTWQKSNYLFDITNPALDRDGYTNSISLTQDVAVPKTKLSLRGGLHQSWTKTEGDDYDFDSFAMSLALWHPFFFEKSRISVGLSYAQNDYKHPNSRSSTSKERDDERLRFSCSLTKELTEDITAFISYSRIDNKSNIGVFDYTRDIYTVGVTYNF